MRQNKFISVFACLIFVVSALSGCSKSSPTGTIRSGDDFAATSMSYFNKLSSMISVGDIDQLNSLRKQGKYVWLDPGTEVSLLSSDKKTTADYIQVNSGTHKGMKLYIDAGQVS